DASVLFTYPPTPALSPLSLHDALPILAGPPVSLVRSVSLVSPTPRRPPRRSGAAWPPGRRSSACCPRPWTRSRTAGRGTAGRARSEEHTSELQSRENLVCRLLLEKKKE